MILKRARFRNFGSYGNELQTMNFSDGINLISGTNGVGKSTLLEPLFFGLYGKPFKKGNLADIVNWTNEGGTEVWIDLENDGHEIEIYRSMTEQRLILDGVEKTEFATNKTAFQREIDRLVGVNHSLFRKLGIISADAIKAVPDMKAGEKREMVDEYFSLKIIALMSSIAKTRRTSLNTDVDLIEKRILVLNGEIDKIKSGIEFSEETMQATIKKIDESIRVIEEVDVPKYLKDIDVKIDELNTSTDQLKIDSDNIDDEIEKAKKIKEEKVENIKKKLTVVEDEKTVKIDEAKIENEKIEKKIENKKVDIENAKAKHIELTNTSIDKTKKAIEETQAKLVVDGEEKAVIDEEEENLTKEIKESKSEDVIRAEISKIDNELSEITLLGRQGSEKKKFLDENDICPTCDNPLTEEHKKEEIDRLKEERVDLKTRKEKLLGEKTKLENSLEKLKVLNKTLRDVQQRERENEESVFNHKNDIEKYTKEIETLERWLVLPPEKEAEINKEIDSLKSELIDINELDLHYRDRLQKGKEMLAEAEKPVEDDSKERLATIKAKIESNDNAIESLNENKTATKKRAESDIEKLNADKECKDLTGRIAELKDQLKKKSKALTAENKKLNVAKDDLEVMERVIVALSDKGVKTHFIKQFVPSLNKTIKDMVRMFSLPIEVTFDEKLNINVKNHGARKRTKYHQHSKGERKRIDFVILLAFIDNVMKIMNWKTNFIIFDEFLDGGMDSKGMDDIIEMLHTFADGYEMGVYIITHKVSNDYFKERWMIEKEDGFSRIDVKR